VQKWYFGDLLREQICCNRLSDLIFWQDLTHFEKMNQSMSAAQLAALDANKDGKLNGTDFNGLNAWGDSDEVGLGQSSAPPPRAALADNHTTLRAKDNIHWGNGSQYILFSTTATEPASSDPMGMAILTSTTTRLITASKSTPTCG
jgi:hypothetical protein